MGARLIRVSSSTQAIQIFSSAEAEFLAMVRGASIGFGAAMSKNLVHLHTPLLWLQSKVGDGEIETGKIRGIDTLPATLPLIKWERRLCSGIWRCAYSKDKKANQV
eukprot:4492456-Amphidinium_carterae.5